MPAATQVVEAAAPPASSASSKRGTKLRLPGKARELEPHCSLVLHAAEVWLGPQQVQARLLLKLGGRVHALPWTKPGAEGTHQWGVPANPSIGIEGEEVLHEWLLDGTSPPKRCILRACVFIARGGDSLSGSIEDSGLEQSGSDICRKTSSEPFEQALSCDDLSPRETAQAVGFFEVSLRDLEDSCALSTLTGPFVAYERSDLTADCPPQPWAEPILALLVSWNPRGGYLEDRLGMLEQATKQLSISPRRSTDRPGSMPHEPGQDELLPGSKLASQRRSASATLRTCRPGRLSRCPGAPRRPRSAAVASLPQAVPVRRPCWRGSSEADRLLREHAYLRQDIQVFGRLEPWLRSVEGGLSRSLAQGQAPPSTCSGGLARRTFRDDGKLGEPIPDEVWAHEAPRPDAGLLSRSLKRRILEIMATQWARDPEGDGAVSLGEFRRCLSMALGAPSGSLADRLWRQAGALDPQASLSWDSLRKFLALL